MTKVATEIAKKIVNGTPEIDTNNLYIDVERIDKDIISVSYRYKGQYKQSPDLTDLMYGDKSKPTVNTKLTGEVFTRLATSTPKTSKGPCRNTYIVEYAAVNAPGGGWGRLLYYIAMHYAGKNGITADRVKSSSDAVAAWNKLWEDGEVKKLSLDDFHDPTTPDLSDDCNLASSGVYALLSGQADDKSIHSAEAHDWNKMLQGAKRKRPGEESPEEQEESPEEKAQRAEKYKKEKASKLNYVYIADSREAINLLNDAGKLSYNGKFSPQKTALPTQQALIPQPIAIKENRILIYNLLFNKR